MALTPILRDVAFLPLPETGFDVLYQLRSEPVWAALAVNGALPQRLLDLLAAGTGHSASVALARTRDCSLLTRDRLTTRHGAVGVAGNPSTSPALLVELLSHDAAPVRRAAVFNPSTPPGAVARAAASRSASELLGPAPGNTTLAAARPSRALGVHPHLGEVWASDPEGTARRAVARQPGLTPTAASTLQRHRVGWDAAAANPYAPSDAFTASDHAARARVTGLLGPGGVSSVPLLLSSIEGRSALMSAASPTLDLLLADAPGLTLEEATRLVRRPLGVLPVEADVLARLVDRFGPPLALLAVGSLAGTRCSAAADLSPTMRAVLALPTQLSPAAWAPFAETLSARLGGDARRWELFLGLASSWHEGAEDLVEAVTLL